MALATNHSSSSGASLASIKKPESLGRVDPHSTKSVETVRASKETSKYLKDNDGGLISANLISSPKKDAVIILKDSDKELWYQIVKVVFGKNKYKVWCREIDENSNFVPGGHKFMVTNWFSFINEYEVFYSV